MSPIDVFVVDKTVFVYYWDQKIAISQLVSPLSFASSK